MLQDGRGSVVRWGGGVVRWEGQCCKMGGAVL